MTIGLGTSIWSADGNFGVTADGYPGWSADGYEPNPESFATVKLAAAGLNVGTITYTYGLNGTPLGWVITGYPALFGRVPSGSYVNLVVSNGPAPAPTPLTVPNVLGKFYSDAQLALLQAGFLIASPTFVLSATVKPQYVISQSIAPGTQFTQQTQVSIVVSGFRVTNQPGVVVPVP